MAANIYYVDGAVGNDSNTGLSEGAGNALATVAAGLLKITAVNERLYIKSSATYNETATLSTFSPAITTPARVEGYDSTPGDGGMITMQNNAALNYGITGSKSYYIWKNIKVLDYSHTGFNMSTGNYNQFWNCVANDCVSRGFYIGSQVLLHGCEAHNAGYAPIQANTGTTVINTIATDDGSATYTMKLTSYSRVLNSICTGGNTCGMYISNNVFVANCVFDGYGTKKGLYLPAGYYQMVLMNNIFYDCGQAIHVQSEYPTCQFGYGNLMYSNTTDYTNWNPTDNDITGQDPLFTDAANGDYTLGTGSPAIGIGLIDMDGEEKMDAGAYQTPLPTAGGTSRIILTS